MVKFRHKGMVVKGKPGLKEEKDTIEMVENQWRQFMKQNALTLFVAAFFIIPNLSAVLWPYMSTLWNSQVTTAPLSHDSEQPPFEPHIPIESHQRASLFEQYQVNYAEVMRIRRDNMKRYSYN